MKNIFKVLIFLVTILTITSCTKKDEVVVNESLDEFLKRSETTVSLYTQMINKAQLDIYKNGDGPFTWMVPTNTALQNVGLTQDSINKLSVGGASLLVMYNLFGTTATAPTPLTTSEIGQTSSARASLLSSTNAFVGSKGSDFFVNGSKIISADNPIKNGYVNVIENFNVPPQLTGNVSTILSRLNNTDTLFWVALRKVGLLNTITASTAITVLAPTNTAMINAGYSLAVLNTTFTPAQTTTLTNILRYHYFPGLRYFSNDFRNGFTPFTALNNRALTVTNNGASIAGTNNTTPVNITATNRLGTNGVVHVIDGVLRP